MFPSLAEAARIAKTYEPQAPVPGLVPGTHVFVAASGTLQDVDDRDKPGHGALLRGGDGNQPV
jgi:hypothetical protein